MREVSKNILLLVTMLAFVVSATGFRLVKHTCPSCNIVEYALHNSASCCETETPAEAQEPVSCCTPVKTLITTCSTAFSSDSCCEYESQLYVIEELVAPSTSKVEAAFVSLPLQMIKPDLSENIPSDHFLAAYQRPPPPVLSGTEYLVFLHQLKIAFC